MRASTVRAVLQLVGLPCLDPPTFDGRLLPRRGFASQPPLYAVIDSAQWVSVEAVRPPARIAVGAWDFPLRGDVVTHTEREPMFVTWARAGLRSRRRRSRPR